MAKDGDTYHVTSHGQTGGITAGHVNFGPVQRVVDAPLRDALLANLPLSEVVQVSAPLGDGEAITFADEIKVFLRSRGYTVEGSQVVRDKPIYGVAIIVGESPRKVQVGFVPRGV